MAAVTREKRSTAGKRMSSLVGKAQEEDDAFWGHDTWAEDDSGNDSFRESDEESEARVDEFDSDFDESESDHEAEEEAAGAAAEAELQRQEKSQKRKQKFDVAKAGRDLLQKKKGKGKKRAMGDGMNAGLVLNFPPSAAAGGGAAAPAPVAAVPSAPVAPKAKKPPKRRLSPRSPTGKKRSLRAATVTKSIQAASKRQATASSTSTTTTTAKKKQKRFTQEEMLLEAATVTEPENERWLLARQRIQQTEDASQKLSHDDKRGKVICKFRSRRGCLNSITFPEMDHVPDILARKHVAPKKKAAPTLCVITRKPARYRDPKTMLGYYDNAAFKEIRRRISAGEPVDQRKKAKKKSTNVTMLDAAEQQKATKTAPAAAVSQMQQQQQANGHVASAATHSTVKAGVTNGETAKTKPSDTAALLKQKAAALMIATPQASAGRSQSHFGDRVSPRRRKPSAKAMAAVETELIAPGKAALSDVILKMTAPELDAASATAAAYAAHKQSLREEAKGDDTNGSVQGKEVLKNLAKTSVAEAGKTSSGTSSNNGAAAKPPAQKAAPREDTTHNTANTFNNHKDKDECDI